MRRAAAYMKQNAVAFLALFVALGGTGAYAANTIGSTDIIDNEIRTADVRNDNSSGGGLGSIDIANGEMTTLEIRDDVQPFGGLFSQDLAADSVGRSELADGAVGSAELAFRSVTSDKLAAPDGWHYFGQSGQPGLQSGWVNYDSASSPGSALFANAGYYIDNDGAVHLGGIVKNGTFGGANPIVTLPVSLCPYYYRIFPVSSGNSIGRVTVNYVTANGCAVNADNGVSTYLSLDGIVFRPSQQDSTTASSAARANLGAKTAPRRGSDGIRRTR